MSRRKQARPIKHLDEEGAVADVAPTDIIGKYFCKYLVVLHQDSVSLLRYKN